MTETRWGKVEYVARVRRLGHQRYVVVSRHRTFQAAVKAMAAAFAELPSYKRADVIRSVFGSYYDPVQLCELVRL